MAVHGGAKVLAAKLFFGRENDLNELQLGVPDILEREIGADAQFRRRTGNELYIARFFQDFVAGCERNRARCLADEKD